MVGVSILSFVMNFKSKASLTLPLAPMGTNKTVLQKGNTVTLSKLD
jgi:hypothetical protein